MFVVVYHYQVPMDKTKQYITLEKQAVDVYLEYGCLGVEIYRDAKDPRLWMEVNRFRDREHYLDVLGAVEKDPRVSPLFEEFLTLFKADENKPEKRTYFRMV